MKKRDVEELKRKSKEELQAMAHDLRQELYGMQGELMAGKLKNVKAPKMLKKKIAVVHTLLTAQKNS
jgi:ribosomal protein L29